MTDQKPSVPEKKKRSSSSSIPDKSEDHRKFVRNLFKHGEQFMEELLAENERLKLRVVQLENEIRMLRKEVPPGDTVEELQELFEKLKKEHDELRQHYEEIVAETDSYKNRYCQIEDENERLVNMFVASYQLHSTLDFDMVVQVLLEILLNFVGAGKFALLILDSEEERFIPLQAYGLPVTDLPPLPADEGVVANAAQAGRPFVAEKPFEARDLDPKHPVVCIPLRVGNDVIGALVIYTFLQQKKEIVSTDLELFKLLSDHAGAVLESAHLYCVSEKRKRSLAVYKALLAAESEP